MKVLVACEFSGIVRDAFAVLGHDAWSCDYRPSERPGPHIQGSVLEHEVVTQGWDLMVAHPDCTYLAVSGAKHMSIEWREEAQLAALHFVKALWKFPIERIAIENPIGRLSSLWHGPTQIVEPFHFGDPFRKATCLWLKNLPGWCRRMILAAGGRRVGKNRRHRSGRRTGRGPTRGSRGRWPNNGEDDMSDDRSPKSVERVALEAIRDWTPDTPTSYARRTLSETFQYRIWVAVKQIVESAGGKA